MSWYQADLRTWDPGHFFDRGGVGNVGRIAFVVVHAQYDRATGRIALDPPVVAATLPVNAYTAGGRTAPGTSSHLYPDPAWSHGLDVDPSTGRVYLAIGDYASSAVPGAAHGSIRVGTSDDRGRTWRWVRIPALPAVGGRAASPFRPTIAVRDGVAFVGCHWITDLGSGSGVPRGLPIVGEGYAVSFDGGGTFSVRAEIPGAAWPASALASSLNGPGVRDRAASAADGRFVFAYGDGRAAAAAGSTDGPSSIHLSVVSLDLPRGSDRRR